MFSFHAIKTSLQIQIKPKNERKISFLGSLTVETALVLPMFMFAMISLLYLSEVIRYSDDVAAGLHQCAREMAVKAYLIKDQGDKGEVAGHVGGIIISNSYVQKYVNDYLKADNIQKGDISYLRSKILDDDIIDLVAEEQIVLPYDFLGIGQFIVTDRARVHAFTGYNNLKFDEEKLQEEIVYVTPTGTVYHRDRFCSHINIKPILVSREDICMKRNNSGGKYYACEYCNKNTYSDNIFITEYGDRYHTKINCSALKRDIIAIPISKVKGRTPCKSCGGLK